MPDMWKCCMESRDVCLDMMTVIGVRSAGPGDPSLYFPNTSLVSATQTGTPQGPSCSFTTIPGLVTPAPVLL